MTVAIPVTRLVGRSVPSCGYAPPSVLCSSSSAMTTEYREFGTSTCEDLDTDSGGDMTYSQKPWLIRGVHLQSVWHSGEGVYQSRRWHFLFLDRTFAHHLVKILSEVLGQSVAENWMFARWSAETSFEANTSCSCLLQTTATGVLSPVIRIDFLVLVFVSPSI